MPITESNTFSPKQLARAIGVSEASVKRWCDKGLIATSKTAGGHRRLALPAILHFLQASRYELVHPDVLGLPSTVGRGPRTLKKAAQLYREALEAGDEEQCLQIVLDLHLAHHSIGAIGDDVIAEAFYEIGQRWAHNETSVYQERRGVEITQRILNRLREILPPPHAAAPQAVGATLDYDPYSLPGHLVDLVLYELRWRSHCLGTALPVQSLCQALIDMKPRIFWLSVSTFGEEKQFIDDFQTLTRTAETCHTAVVIGGRMLTTHLRKALHYSSYCDNLRHLQAFAKTLYSEPTD